MKKGLIILFTFLSFLSYSQNVSLEISDWAKKMDGKDYATFQFVRSSYSFSRATRVFITDKKTLVEIYTELPKIFAGRKQEYTDIWILGIMDFNPENISETDKKIIDLFNSQIIKYRNDYNLPIYSEEELNQERIILRRKADICNYYPAQKMFLKGNTFC